MLTCCKKKSMEKYVYSTTQCNWTKKQDFGCLMPQKPNMWGRSWCKRKELLLRCRVIWENGDSHPKARLPRQSKPKASLQSSLPNLRHNYLEPAGGCLVVTVPIQVGRLVSSCCSFQAPCWSLCVELAPLRALWLRAQCDRVLPGKAWHKYMS